MRRGDESEFVVRREERIVEGRTVTVRERGVTYALHVLIVEHVTKAGRRFRGCEIHAPTGIPYRHKDDSLWGLHANARTVREAVRQFMAAVRENRWDTRRPRAERRRRAG